MAFRNSILAATVLLREAIRSPNYEPNVSGWTINQDGSAEFNNIVIRGGTVVSGLALYYDGPPALGNLILSISAQAGTDEYGNDYLQGLGVYGTDGVMHALGSEFTVTGANGSAVNILTGGAGQANLDLVPRDLLGAFWNSASVYTTLGSSDRPGLGLSSPSEDSNATHAGIILFGGGPTTSDTSILVGADRVNFSDNVDVSGDLSVDGVGQIQHALRTSDLSRNNATPSDDPQLQFPVAANATYALSGWIKYSALVDADIQLDWSHPAVALGEWAGHGAGLSTTGQTTNGYLIRTESNDLSQSRNFSGTTGTVGTYSVFLEGTLRTAGTSGTYALQWAQGNLDAGNPTTVYTDSRLRLERIA